MAAQIIGILIVVLLGGGFLAAAIFSLIKRGSLEERAKMAEKANDAYKEATDDRKQIDESVSGLSRQQLIERMRGHTHRND